MKILLAALPALNYTDILKVVAGGGVGVALVVVYYMFLRASSNRDDKIAAAVREVSGDWRKDREAADERFESLFGRTERLFDQVITNGHEMALAVNDLSHAITQQSNVLSQQSQVISEHSKAIGEFQVAIADMQQRRNALPPPDTHA